MDIGVSIRLTRAECEQAIKERALAVARTRGLSPDQLDFHNRARVHFLATPTPEGPQPVPLDYVDITLET